MPQPLTQDFVELIKKNVTAITSKYTRSALSSDLAIKDIDTWSKNVYNYAVSNSYVGIS